MIAMPGRYRLIDWRLRWPLSGTALSLVLVAFSAGAQPVVPADWSCRYCPFESGLSSTWGFGSGFLSDDSGKFGDYTGLNDDGFYWIAEGELRYWGDAGSYWELLGADLGLDSRSFALDGGQPGRYRLQINYDALPSYRIDGAQTPYLGIGSASLNLPANWTPAGSTGGMLALTQGLSHFDVAQQRRELGLGFAWLAAAQLDYRIDYRREERSGIRSLAGSFATLSAWLPAPIDYVTDEFELGLSHAGERGGFELSYFLSDFTNDRYSLEWESPFSAFTPAVGGRDLGRLALAPDNQAYQLHLSGNYRIGTSTHLSASYSGGRLEQDDPFLPLSRNALFANTALPRASLDGRIDTSHLNAAIVTQPMRSLRLTARFKRDERHNKTAQAAYDYVLTDLGVGGSRINLPYGFQRTDMSVQADYRLPSRMRLQAGFDRDIHERTFQARLRSEEDSAWTKLSVRTFSWVQGTIGLTDRKRTGSDYRQIDLGSALQNPLMRQYHLADREQRIAELDLSIIPHERVNLLLRAEQTRDEYPASALGLTAGKSSRYSFDTSLALAEDFNVYASWGREDVEFGQAGSQGFGAADWSALTEDMTKTRSFGFTQSFFDERMNLSVDFSDSKSRGMTRTFVGIPLAGFPDFSTDLNSLSLRLDYAISESLQMRLGYRNERYTSGDWQLDGLRLVTLANVLTFGAQNPAYNLDMLTLSFSYTPVRH
jgi:MtrB/PioB family decaheme-associated outer membrane protein